MKKITTLLLPILAAFNLKAATLINGGFETGNLNGWSFSEPSNSFSSSVFLHTASQPSQWNNNFGFFTPQTIGGNYSFFTGFDGFGPQQIVLSQNIGTIDSESDAISFYIRGAWDLIHYSANATADRTIVVEIVDNNTQTVVLSEELFVASIGTYMADTGLQYVGINFNNLVGTNATLRFIQSIPDPYTGPAMLQIDDIELKGFYEPITNIPEPGVLTLLPLGLAVVLILRKR